MALEARLCEEGPCAAYMELSGRNQVLCMRYRAGHQKGKVGVKTEA